MCMNRFLVLFALLWGPTLANAQRVYPVSTVQELIAAIGPNRILELESGEYRMQDFEGVSDNQYAFFTSGYDGGELIIKDVWTMTIRAKKGIPHLITAPQYGHVMVFRGCGEIGLEGLRMGHGPEKGYCEGGVIRLEECEEVSIVKCDLYGSGIEGITGVDSKHIRVSKTTIRDCTYGLCSFSNCERVTFDRCKLIDSEEYDLISLRECTAVLFVHCTISGNRTGSYEWSGYSLFQVNDSRAVSVVQCKIGQNEADHLVNREGRVEFSRAKFSGNTWRKGRAGE